MQTHLKLECQTSFSSERLSTYLSACYGDMDKAMELYLWNMYVAGLFMPLLNLVEVILRNRIALALTTIHGTHWAWNTGFHRMVPTHSFNPKQEIQNLSHKYHKTKATGKLIADCKFVFWQHLLTSRYQKPIWNKHLTTSFPYLATTQNRATLEKQIDQIRELRNRIAHHEPIFQRDLLADYQNIRNFLSASQSPSFMDWLDSHQTISLIATRIMR